jgi:pilus assembly protein Flp/PilA
MTRGCLNCRGSTLQDESTAAAPPAFRRRTQVEKLRLLPVKAYLGYVGLRDREEGQALVEYALLLALIAVVSIGILTLLGGNVSKIFSRINNKL